jgi:cytoskeletal protein CcmA (bactofilin family)
MNRYLALTIAAARTLNGDIHVGAHATVQSLHTVNGGITLDTGARVNETVTSINGALTMRDDAQVSGAVSNVNGDIVLTGAHVAGGITTVNGDISLMSNSHVEGGILVRRKSSAGWFNRDGNGPRIVIGPGASVQGELKFERQVQLYVSDRASIGAVSGATAIRFAGENPPG